ncbi:MAG: hypothetical protein KDA98_17875, partial [Acidimicrobiales bacterium]|nr:hypothetical protein [Acidimicrobiales bacterium]
RNVVVAAGSVVRGTFADHDIIAGVPARVVRRREPGVGWVRPDGTGDVIPESPTIAPEDLHAALDGLDLDPTPHPTTP